MSDAPATAATEIGAHHRVSDRLLLDLSERIGHMSGSLDGLCDAFASVAKRVGALESAAQQAVGARRALLWVGRAGWALLGMLVSIATLVANPSLWAALKSIGL